MARPCWTCRITASVSFQLSRKDSCTRNGWESCSTRKGTFSLLSRDWSELEWRDAEDVKTTVWATGRPPWANDKIKGLDERRTEFQRHPPVWLPANPKWSLEWPNEGMQFEAVPGVKIYFKSIIIIIVACDKTWRDWETCSLYRLFLQVARQV